MAKWSFNDLNESAQILSSSKEIDIHPLIAQLLFSRGIKTEKEIREFIAPDYQRDSFDPFAFEDMEKVVARIDKARKNDEMVVVFGDYDADGITSSAIIKQTLDLLEINSFVYIPDKRTEGYGMNVEAIEKFAQKKVALIITVDCGITNIIETEKALELGIDVIITDHHHVPEILPAAHAIINPHAKNAEKYPFKDLAGVGVAFKVVQAIFQRLMPEKMQLSKWMLDLVAIVTIADCVPLIGENRLFVRYGLIVLSKTRRTGINELCAVGRIMIDEDVIPDTKKVSFYIAPRINAAGRINHANLAYDLIMENNVVAARDFALELEESNTERQKITQTVVDEVKILAENMFAEKKFIFAIGEHFPIGVVGLVAGKIVQQFNKPTAIFQKGEKISKGSFRSIPQINIIETIEQCGKLLEKHGGHSQAAGVSVANENLEKFYEKMDFLINEKLDGVDLVPEIKVDAELDVEIINFKFLEDLEKLKPFGQGNDEPIFAIRNLIVREKRVLGSGNKHIKFFLSPTNGEPKIFEAVSFNGFEKYQSIKEDDVIDVLCNVQKDEWNGNKKIQLMIVDIKNASL